MLSDEEREAVEIIKGLAVYYDDYSLLDKEEIEENEEVNNSINIVINLIEKQSKEIEELKEENRIQRKRLNDAFDRGWIHEDKIKAKIEESELLIDNSQGCMSNEDLYKEYGKIEFGQSLLEKE